MQPSVIVMLSAAMGVIAMPLRPRPAQENSNNSTAQQSDQLLNQTSQAVGNPVAQQPDQLNNTSTTSPPMGNPVEQKPDQLNQTSSPIGGATAQQADQLNPTTTPPMDKPALQQSQPNQPNQSSPPMGTGSPSGSQPQPDRRNQIKPNDPLSLLEDMALTPPAGAPEPFVTAGSPRDMSFSPRDMPVPQRDVRYVPGYLRDAEPEWMNNPRPNFVPRDTATGAAQTDAAAKAADTHGTKGGVDAVVHDGEKSQLSRRYGGGNGYGNKLLIGIGADYYNRYAGQGRCACGNYANNILLTNGYAGRGY